MLKVKVKAIAVAVAASNFIGSGIDSPAQRPRHFQYPL
jgi:hypothetical protein